MDQGRGRTEPQNQKGLRALSEAVAEYRRHGQDSVTESDPAQSLPPPGSPFGPFVLEAELGRGGMGVVYRARRKASGEELALKLLHPGWQQKSHAMDRMRREASALKALDDPGILAIREVGEIDGRAYLAMDLLPGPSLADLIDCLQRLPPALPSAWPAALARQFPELQWLTRAGTWYGPLLHWFLQVAHALQAVHEAGILHRDVKPDNLILNRKGRLVLTDFGIAWMASSQVLTRPGDLVGSPAYLSPEQAQGRKADVRSEIYALGLCLYELLAGDQPFQRDTLAETLTAVRQHRLPSLAQRCPGLPPGIVAVVAKAMAFSPKNRYASMAEFAEELRRLLDGRVPQAMTWRHRVFKARKALLGSFVGLVLAGFLGGYVVSESRWQQRMEHLSQKAGDPQIREALRPWLMESSPSAHGLWMQAREILQSPQRDRLAEFLPRLETRLRSEEELPDTHPLWPAWRQLKIDWMATLEARLHQSSEKDRNQATLWLSEFLLDPDPWIAKNAAVILGRSGGPWAVGALHQAYFLHRESIRNGEGGGPLAFAFIEALGKLHHASAFPSLQKIVDTKDVEIRLHAVRALAWTPGLDARVSLQNISESDPAHKVRSLATKLLARR
ncbi:MAG: hypothetical protein DWQ01_22630 [Planctomycetota bacterium]|nr:MAG: hypothetical protein DWQ01_22630 [Planctomycetota bacterium]